MFGRCCRITRKGNASSAQAGRAVGNLRDRLDMRHQEHGTARAPQVCVKSRSDA